MVNKSKKITKKDLPPSYKDVKKNPSKYNIIFKKNYLPKYLPSYEETIEYDYELEQTGVGKGLCKICNKGIHRYWKKNADGDIFHKFCYKN